MDVLVAGMPGPLLRWTCDVVSHAASLAHRALAFEAVSADGGWMPPDGPCPGPPPAGIRLFVAHHPGEAIAAAVREGRLAALLVVDDPVQALLEMRRAGVERDVALRGLSSSATLLGEMTGSGSALVVAQRSGLGDDSLLDRVQAYLGLALRPADVAMLAERFGAGGLGAAPAEAVSQPAADGDGLTPEDVAIIDGALAPACVYVLTGQRGAVTWPRACLFWGDHPGEPAPRVLGLTGPSRVLVYGPYFHLASGCWTARAILAFSPACRDMAFSVELHGSAEFGRCEFVVDQAGVFAVTFPVTVRSAREPLEMRLVSRRGAIEGTLGIERIEFRPEPV